MKRRDKRDLVDVPGLSDAIKADIYEHIYVNDDHEVGGVLVGTLGEATLPTVTGSIAALEARGERASVTFTHDAWATVHATLERDFPDQQIVGWYHSHPGFGIFLSSHDLFIHENFFSDPRQVAYVVDPHAGTEGLFVWRDGKVAELYQRPAGRAGTGREHRFVVDVEDESPPDTAGGDAGFMRRAVTLAAILGAMSGVTAQMLLADDGTRQATTTSVRPAPAATAASPTRTATAPGTKNGTASAPRTTNQTRTAGP